LFLGTGRDGARPVSTINDTINKALKVKKMKYDAHIHVLEPLEADSTRKLWEWTPKHWAYTPKSWECTQKPLDDNPLHLVRDTRHEYKYQYK
jgi:hypothetical protein